jgi:hypothetical protein
MQPRTPLPTWFRAMWWAGMLAIYFTHQVGATGFRVREAPLEFGQIACRAASSPSSGLAPD